MKKLEAVFNDLVKSESWTDTERETIKSNKDVILNSFIIDYSVNAYDDETGMHLEDLQIYNELNFLAETLIYC